MNTTVTYLLETPVTNGPNGPSSALASARYRALLPGRELTAMGMAVRYADARAENVVSSFDGDRQPVTIVGKSFDPKTLAMARRAKQAGSRLIVDFCDDHFLKADIGAHFRELAAAADATTTSTEAMASVVRRETGMTASVIADPVEGPRGEPRFQPNVERINLCWFGHPTNLDTLQPLFFSMAERLGTGSSFLGGRSIRFEIVTSVNDALLKSLGKIAQNLGRRVKLVATPWSPAVTWEALARADAVLIPSLEREDKSVKSPNRLLEAINAGCVTIAHPLPSYAEFRGCAYLEADLWAALEMALRDPEAAVARVRKGQAEIAERYTPVAIARQWLAVINDARAPEGPNARTGIELGGIGEPIRLNLGCGDKVLPGYVNVDVAPSRRGQKPDVLCDIRQLSAFQENYADEVLAVHVVEHLWRWEIVDILKEWKRVLKPGGRIVLECPNLLSACEALLRDPEKAAGPDIAGQRTMWVFYGDPSWKDPLMSHRWAYTPRSLGQVMQEAGFVNIRQEPAQFKLREPRDMRVVGRKPSA